MFNVEINIEDMIPNTEEKRIGESLLSGTPQKAYVLKLKEGSVTTDKLASKAVTAEKIGDDVVPEIINPNVDPKIAALAASVQVKIDEIWDIINSAAHEGPYFEQCLGEKEHMGISQKVITDNINNIWNMFNTITGSEETELTMTVTPTYFDDDSCVLRISASSNGPTAFDTLRFFVGTELIYEEHNISSVDDITFTVTDSCTVKCQAIILGKPYYAEQRISKYAELWIGGGSAYDDVRDPEDLNKNRYEITGSLAGTYNISVINNDYIFIIMSEVLAEGFIKAEMDGFEIPFIRHDDTPSGYVCFQSANTYIGGNYNIDLY